MRRAIVAIASTVIGLVLLLSFKTHAITVAQPQPAVSTPSPGAPAAPSPTTGSTAGPTTDPTGAPTGGGSSTGPATVTGDESWTRFGPVQVRVTVKDGRVTDVTATEYPWGDPRSQQISAYAIPVLNEEALQAGNANISMVSGATYTCEGYLSSLQSALDKAGVQ